MPLGSTPRTATRWCCCCCRQPQAAALPAGRCWSPLLRGRAGAARRAHAVVGAHTCLLLRDAATRGVCACAQPCLGLCVPLELVWCCRKADHAGCKHTQPVRCSWRVRCQNVRRMHPQTPQPGAARDAGGAGMVLRCEHAPLTRLCPTLTLTRSGVTHARSWPGPRFIASAAIFVAELM
jgi:hypothetical protein